MDRRTHEDQDSPGNQAAIEMKRDTNAGVAHGELQGNRGSRIEDRESRAGPVSSSILDPPSSILDTPFLPFLETTYLPQASRNTAGLGEWQTKASKLAFPLLSATREPCHQVASIRGSRSFRTDRRSSPFSSLLFAGLAASSN
jgi:hypothetical protein